MTEILSPYSPCRCPDSLHHQSTEEEQYNVGGIEDDGISHQWVPTESYGDRPNIYEPDPEALTTFTASSMGERSFNGQEMDCMDGNVPGNRDPCLLASPDLYGRSVSIREDEELRWRGPTEGACSMAVPATSRTSALRMPFTHPAIRNANHR